MNVTTFGYPSSYPRQNLAAWLAATDLTRMASYARLKKKPASLRSSMRASAMKCDANRGQISMRHDTIRYDTVIPVARGDRNEAGPTVSLLSQRCNSVSLMRSNCIYGRRLLMANTNQNLQRSAICTHLYLPCCACALIV